MVYIQSGGAVINTNGFNSGANAVLRAPEGNGLTSIPIAAGAEDFVENGWHSGFRAAHSAGDADSSSVG